MNDRECQSSQKKKKYIDVCDMGLSFACIEKIGEFIWTDTMSSRAKYGQFSNNIHI